MSVVEEEELQTTAVTVLNEKDREKDTTRATEDLVKESLELVSLKLRQEIGKTRNADADAEATTAIEGTNEQSRTPSPIATSTSTSTTTTTSTPAPAPKPPETAAQTTTTTVITIPIQRKDEISNFSSTPALAPRSSIGGNAGGTALTARQLFRDAAGRHGATESNALLQHEISSAQQRPRNSSTTDIASISRNTSSAGGFGKHEKKIGHRRVGIGGEVTYKRIQSKQIMGSIQLGIQHTVGGLASKPNRDLLMNDFYETETTPFPPDGSAITPAHHYSDFRFKTFAPIAFRFFRNLFGIAPDDFLISMCAAPLRQLSNPGASGSIFYLTADDEFIIKTVQNKECEFLQKLLPGYYMNLSQNPRTLLPKFFGLYCFHYNTKNVRLVAMNNLLPSDIKMHSKYDLKGSTFRRKASKAERQKASPTYKDLDFLEQHPSGIFLETDTYNALIRTIQRDCRVLESFQIMDYSLLVGIHNMDIAAKEKREERIRNARLRLQRADGQTLDDTSDVDQQQTVAVTAGSSSDSSLPHVSSAASIAGGAVGGAGGGGGGSVSLNRTRSMNRQRLVAHSTALESIHADIDMTIDEDDEVPAGGIPARSENDERLILFIGIIDILQSYRLEKKLEHAFKSLIHNGDTVSVCKPSYYAERFQNFMSKTVFKKTPTFPLKHSPSRRKTSTLTLRTPQRPSLASNSNNNLITQPRPPTLVTSISGMSTPPPAFEDISEEDMTATESIATLQPRQTTSITNAVSSYVSSNHSFLSSDDYSGEEESPTTSASMSPRSLRSSNISQRRAVNRRALKLTMTNVQVAAIGCVPETPKSPSTPTPTLAASPLPFTLNMPPTIVENGEVVHLEQYDANNGTPVINTVNLTVVQSQTTSKTYKSTLVLENDTQ